MITEELKQKNFELFVKKMEDFGVTAERIQNVFGDKLINASFAIEPNSMLTYEGSLLHVVLRTFTPYAIKLNGLLPDEIKADQKSLVKVCLLQHLAKAFMFEKNDNAWEIEKLGKTFKYSQHKIALRLGARSLVLAMKLGVELNEYEVEALTIIDKGASDEQAKFFATPISVIVRQANELTTLESIFK